MSVFPNSQVVQTCQTSHEQIISQALSLRHLFDLRIMKFRFKLVFPASAKINLAFSSSYDGHHGCQFTEMFLVKIFIFFQLPQWVYGDHSAQSLQSANNYLIACIAYAKLKFRCRLYVILSLPSIL